MSHPGEFGWISKYLAPLASKYSFGLQDDAALLQVPEGYDLVVTQDAIAENVHFLSGDPLDLVARKALRVNVSDMVAKGAKPFAYSMALGMPDSWEDAHMKHFTNGLAHDQNEYGLELTGGDTYRSVNGLSVSVTMFGVVEEGRYTSRLGASSADLLVVSGSIGSSAIGLKIAVGELTAPDDISEALIRSYQVPNPPVVLAETIARYATASMDISDGLIGDCAKLCEASGVSAQINRAKIPVTAHVERLAKGNPELWKDILTGGDDYQVFCTVAPQYLASFQDSALAVGVVTTVIGRLTEAEDEPVLLDMGGLEVSLDRDAYSHF